MPREFAERFLATRGQVDMVVLLAEMCGKAGRIQEGLTILAQALAGEMLVEIYGGFTEGFDTADLKEAKALLGELSEE